MTLPGRAAVGFDPRAEKFVEVKEYNGIPVTAAAAFLPPGYVQTFTSAYVSLPGAPRLPLYCYTAVGWRAGRFHAAGRRVDRQLRHEIPDARLPEIDAKARALRKKFRGNRLVAHLVENCILTYRCPNACNLALGRWECPIPVSRLCNAQCLGCISRQAASSCVPPTQHRLDFTPSVQEIAEYAGAHLADARNPIASFGQGCEGEPLLEGKLIEAAIGEIRSRTKRGIININTNGSRPEVVKRLCDAGLGSMRVSLNSAQAAMYEAYYRPKGYSFDNVVESISIARTRGVWVSVNYLVFPGFTDTTREFDALCRLINKTGLNMVQTRNLNIDPAWYAETLDLTPGRSRPLGMVGWISALQKKFPALSIGYFNPTYATVISKARYEHSR
jgi:pyruvate-formate lyase-activating enzyme